jgi:excisionase family DNA binding protein
MPNENLIPQDPDFLLPAEVAGIYRVNVETIRRKIREKELQALKIGRHWRVPRRELARINDEGGL